MEIEGDRVIVVSDEINAESVQAFLLQFYELDATSGPIHVVVCSGGGWADGGMAIFDVIQNANNHVTTVAVGAIGSIAVLIFEAGAKRIIAKNCSMFLHETSLEAEANMSQLRILSKEIDRIHGLYCKLIADRSGIPTKEMAELTEKDTFLTAGEVLAKGLADEFLESDRKPEPKKKKVKK